MRTKKEYDAMVKFQDKFNVEQLEARITDFWNKNPLPKTKLEVNVWKEVIDGEDIYCFFCNITNPKVGEGRSMSVGTGIGGVKNFLKMMSREYFVLMHEVVFDGKPYDAGEFFDKIKGLE